MRHVDQPIIIISAGGTGGHIFPALALTSVLKERGFKMIWVTDHRGLKFKDQFTGDQVLYVPSATLKAGLISKIKTMLVLALGYIKAHIILLQYQPCAVIGFGGYPSFPTVLAAQHVKIETLIHEQNMTLGKANIMLAPKARRIALWVAETKFVTPAMQDRVRVTGNPVRAAIAALSNVSYLAPKGDKPLRLLILGGSLGASVFSEVVPEYLENLTADQRKRLHITQQCRAVDLESVRARYEKIGVDYILQPFFDDMPAQLEKAHLVITRSGASTVAELTTAGRPAIFVPYPHHADQQQTRNAEYVAAVGGGWCVSQNDFTADFLKHKIDAFLKTPELLENAAAAALSLGCSNAATRLADVVIDIAQRK
jgi:UDP-N-acetylglucosamine--N-acetylmuramyl-(pentapeptide) pyrophosphoryl-undecaprenol N-acetylglucosamine transferase